MKKQNPKSDTRLQDTQIVFLNKDGKNIASYGLPAYGKERQRIKRQWETAYRKITKIPLHEFNPAPCVMSDEEVISKYALYPDDIYLLKCPEHLVDLVQKLGTDPSVDVDEVDIIMVSFVPQGTPLWLALKSQINSGSRTFTLAGGYDVATALSLKIHAGYQSDQVGDHHGTNELQSIITGKQQPLGLRGEKFCACGSANEIRVFVTLHNSLRNIIKNCEPLRVALGYCKGSKLEIHECPLVPLFEFNRQTSVSPDAFIKCITHIPNPKWKGEGDTENEPTIVQTRMVAGELKFVPPFRICGNTAIVCRKNVQTHIPVYYILQLIFESQALHKDNPQKIHHVVFARMNVTHAYFWVASFPQTLANQLWKITNYILARYPQSVYNGRETMSQFLRRRLGERFMTNFWDSVYNVQQKSHVVYSCCLNDEEFVPWDVPSVEKFYKTHEELYGIESDGEDWLHDAMDTLEETSNVSTPQAPKSRLPPVDINDALQVLKSMATQEIKDTTHIDRSPEREIEIETPQPLYTEISTLLQSSSNQHKRIADEDLDEIPLKRQKEK